MANEYYIVSTPPESAVLNNEEITAIISEGQQGPEGIKGDRGEAGATGITRVASIALGGHRLVANTIDGRLAYASNDDAQSAYTLLGITLSAVAPNGAVDVQSFGLVTEPSWTLTPNLPVYLGTNGLLTQVAPTAPAALFSLVVGFAMSTTSIFLNLHEAIYLK